jgi:uncharacterized protein
MAANSKINPRPTPRRDITPRLLIGGALLVVIVIILGVIAQIVLLATTQSRSPAPIQFAPAQMYEDANAAANRGDFVTALRIIRPLADQGNARAQDFLGFMYADGLGVPQDYAEAMRWRRRAANQGNALAQIAIGLMYRDGHGVPKDYIRAYMWFELATHSNEPADVAGHYTAAQTALVGRDDVAQYMTPAQIAEARKLAGEWKPEQ